MTYLEEISLAEERLSAYNNQSLGQSIKSSLSNTVTGISKTTDLLSNEGIAIGTELLVAGKHLTRESIRSLMS